MSILLFAFNRYYPTGGADDLVGFFRPQDLTEEVIFRAVAERLRTEKLERDERIHVHALTVSEDAAGPTQRWEFRMQNSLDAPALQFCSIKEVLPELGPCGLAPVTQVEELNALNEPYDWCYLTLDPEKRDLVTGLPNAPASGNTTSGPSE